MKVGLKNAVDLVPELAGFFDFAVNEECNAYNECDVSFRRPDKRQYLFRCFASIPGRYVWCR